MQMMADKKTDTLNYWSNNIRVKQKSELGSRTQIHVGNADVLATGDGRLVSVDAPRIQPYDSDAN
jgi:hypothetical protein